MGWLDGVLEAIEIYLQKFIKQLETNNLDSVME